MHIREAKASDARNIAAIIIPIIREAATYALDPDMSETAAMAYWMGHDKETFVAEEDGVVLGTYYMRPNQAGGGMARVQLRLHRFMPRLAGAGSRDACASIR